MQTRVFSTPPPHGTLDLTGLERPQSWGLMYGVRDFPLGSLTEAIVRAHPGIALLGATSFQGVFSGARWQRGAALLTADATDGVQAATALRATGPERAKSEAASAAREVADALGRTPSLVVLHATPGFEESVLAGITEALGPGVEVYGGSAADDDINGGWRVFTEKASTSQGLALAGFTPSTRDVALHGGFIAGYLPTAKRGVVTRASGRVILEIDGQPAAVVYNRWTGGAIENAIARGGNVLLKTNLRPLARELEVRSGMPRRLLSHPNEVLVGGGLALFTEISEGDSVELMIGTPEPLVSRAGKVVKLALGRGGGQVTGGLLVYCGGCLAAVMNQANDIARAFDEAVGGAPYVGLATFGEQGCFGGVREKLNRHGNLMCSAVLFSRR